MPSTGRPLPDSPVSCPATHLGLLPASRAFPFSWGRCAALATRPSLSCPIFPSSRVYTPPGCQQPFAAGPPDPHLSGDHFVCLALVAPFPPPSAWVVCFLQNPSQVLLPGPRFPRYPCLFSSWSPAVAVFFRAPPAVPRLPVCSFPFPRRLLALCFAPPGGAVGSCFFFGPPPPFPLCILPCGSLLPVCTHISTAQVIWSRLPSVLFSCPIALFGRGPWRSPAMPGGAPPSRLSPLSPLFPPLTSVSCPPSY